MFVQLKEEELIGSPSTAAPRYLQQDFLLFAEHFASIAGFEAFLPFAAAFFFAFTSLTSFRWSDSRVVTRWFNLPLLFCSSGLGELAFQGRVTRQIHKVVP